jgi:flagellar operon protein
MSIPNIYRSLGPIGPVEARVPSASEVPQRKEGAGISEFEKVLQQQSSGETGLKFSSHAETRIRSRAIPWNDDLEKRVLGGIGSAREKGSREALILAGNVAVIANVKSGTVITAMDASNLKERIFTNIDSAVIV